MPTLITVTITFPTLVAASNYTVDYRQQSRVRHLILLIIIPMTLITTNNYTSDADYRFHSHLKNAGNLTHLRNFYMK